MNYNLIIQWVSHSVSGTNVLEYKLGDYSLSEINEGRYNEFNQIGPKEKVIEMKNIKIRKE